MSTENYIFSCPQCGGHNLQVTCQVDCKITQEEDNFETEPADGTDWYFDDMSIMTCQDCDFFGKVSEFKVSANTSVSGDEE